MADRIFAAPPGRASPQERLAAFPEGVSHPYDGQRRPTGKKGLRMGLILGVLLLVLILGGLGFAIHVLWIIAVIAFLVWLIGFFVSGAERRWYHW